MLNRSFVRLFLSIVALSGCCAALVGFSHVYGQVIQCNSGCRVVDSMCVWHVETPVAHWRCR